MQMIVLALAGSMSAAQQGHRRSPKDTSVCPAHTHTHKHTHQLQLKDTSESK